MTTVQTMLAALRAVVACCAPIAAISALLLAGACSKQPELVAPEPLIAPYNSASGEMLWAVAPLANESGTSIADTLAISDAIVGKITEAEGLAAVPMNRTLAAMRALRMTAVRTPADARRLGEALNVDAVLVGSVTAYDPYDPPTIGLTLALYSRQPAQAVRESGWSDPRAMRSAPTEQDLPPVSSFEEEPLSVVIEHLPGANHGVQMNVRRYAQGRHEHGSALGWRRYLASMELYTDFAAYWAVRRLLEEERLRLAWPARRTMDPAR